MFRYILPVSLLLHCVYSDDFEKEKECPVDPPYTIVPFTFGATVYGLNVSKDMYEGLVDRIKVDLYRYKILIFKDQGSISGNQHERIAQWFGKKLEGKHRQHPRAESKQVFRISNDADEGFTNTGDRGWHMDGAFWQRPPEFVIYHMVNVSSRGDTLFVNSNHLITSLPAERFDVWNRLYVRNRGTGIVHPLICRHPVTYEQTLCINTDFAEGLIVDYPEAEAKALPADEMNGIMAELMAAINREDGTHIYHHKWSAGELIVTDNWALCHIAEPDTQLPRSEIGLRVLHRVSVAGRFVPSKLDPRVTNYGPKELQQNVSK